jgi:signal transduction histidine kinase
MESTHNDLASRLARLEELEDRFAEAVERAKLAALKEFAYGASHEINNPLANISTRAQSLLVEETHPERRKKLATIVAQAMRAHEMISDLMLFAKPPPLHLAAFTLTPLVVSVVHSFASDITEKGLKVSQAIEPTDLAVTADETQIGVALAALVRNAVEAVGPGGSIEVKASVAGDQAMLSVADDGPGMTDHVREHLFDPFFSGREAGRGLGFGLCKCWRIAELHGGRITVESTPGQGTRMSLVLPLETKRLTTEAQRHREKTEE